MIDIKKNNKFKYLLFGSLYFSEGIQITLATVIVPIYLLDKGISVPLATLIAGIAAAPWYLKFIFGPLTDHFYHHGKKPFIIIGGLLGAISLFTLIILDPSFSLIPFTIFLFLSHLGIILLDVSCDGWAIQISKLTDRGKINGAMTAGLFTGMTIAASLLGPLAETYGYNTSFLVGGILILFTILLPLIIQEEKIVKRAQHIGTILRKEFKKGTTQLVAVFCSVNGIGFGLLIFAIPLFMKTVLDLSIGQIGLVMSVYPITLVFGSVLGGILADRWGRKITIYIFISLGIVFSASLIYTTTWELVALIYGIIGFLQGAGVFSAGGAILMDVSNPKIGATQYSVFASIINFSEFGFGSISGSLVVALGFHRVFLIAAWSLAPLLFIIYFYRPKKTDIYQ